jgi:hypothetical protein
MRLLGQYQPTHIHVDVDGLGGGVVDRLKELRAPVRGIHALETATLPPKVSGKSASRAQVTRYGRLEATPRAMKDYMWMAMASWFIDDEPSFAGCDKEHAEELVGECTTVRYSFDSSGRLKIESKDDLKKRDLRSPDLAEGLALTFCPDRTRVWDRLV